MPQYSANGLTMRWSDAESIRPGLGRRVFIDVLPASPSNAVRLLYSIDGGPERVARGWMVPNDGKKGIQRFAADLPSVRPDQCMDWRPVVSSGVQKIDPKSSLTSASAAEQGERFDRSEKDPIRFAYELEFLARVTAPLEQNPYAIGMTPDGLRIVFPLGEGGTVCGPRFNGSIDHIGGDWMRIRDDGIGVTDIHALIQTNDGATILSEYSGFVDFGADGQKRLAAGNPPPDANLDLTPRYLTSDKRWAWLNRLQCVGFGRVTMSKLLVEYDLYAMRSRATEQS